MTDLVYPAYPAPVIPARQSVSDRDDSAEMLPVVEVSGAVVGQASRAYCHGGSKPLHPVVHLHIIDRNGRIYLQKRSASKSLLPLRWDTSVGGHISYGESVAEALLRESAEEIGLYDFNPIFLRTHIYETPTEKELVFIFAVVGTFKLTPDKEEVEEVRKWSREEIMAAMGKDILTPMFEEEFRMFYDELAALL